MAALLVALIPVREYDSVAPRHLRDEVGDRSVGCSLDSTGHVFRQSMPVTRADSRPRLFPALLKHWRAQRGLSQLDLALAADVSSRHVSFLETARSTPSAEMVLRLCAVLDVPLRQVNAMLQAAGHDPMYPEAPEGQGIPTEVADALRLMKEHHEPFPLIVIDRAYNVVDLNAGAQRLIAAVAPQTEGAASGPPNLLRLTFDPGGAQPAIVNFDELGRVVLWRVQREVLADPSDGRLRDVLNDVLAMPTVATDWRSADLTVPSQPAVPVHLRAGGVELKFITTVTAFQAPQAVFLDEMRIETWFPSDDATKEACIAMRRYRPAMT